MQAERRALWTALWKQLDEAAAAAAASAAAAAASSQDGSSQQLQSSAGGRPATPNAAAARLRTSSSAHHQQQRRPSASPLPLAASPASQASVVTRLPQSSADSSSSAAAWLSGVLLAVWDNVTGPRVEHAWLSAAGVACAVAPEQLHEIARDALAGTLEDSLVAKTVVLPHAGGVVCSVAFAAPCGCDGGGDAKFSLAAFAPHAALGRALLVHRVVEDRLMHLALATRSVLTRCPDAAVERLGPEVARTVAALEAAVARCTVSPLALFVPAASAASSGGESSSERFGRAVYAAAVAFGVDLLARALTSHLQTRGFSVVVGPDEASVCAVVDTLSAFLFDAHDRALSSRVCAAAGPGSPSALSASSSSSSSSVLLRGSYHPDLVLQGVVGSVKAAGVVEEQLVRAPLPTTVVDLTSSPCNVWQPRSAAEYAVARREFFKLILSKLAARAQLPPRSPSLAPSAFAAAAATASSVAPSPLFPAGSAPSSPLQMPDTTSMPELPELDLQRPPRPMAMHTPSLNFSSSRHDWLPKEGLLAPVLQSSSLVLDLLCQTLRLPVPLRLPYVRNACHVLAAKAITLLKLVASDIKVHKGSTEGSGRWLKDNLGLQDDADLTVVFAFAERLSPGICSAIMADRLTLEEKFIELFEGFV